MRFAVGVLIGFAFLATLTGCGGALPVASPDLETSDMAHRREIPYPCETPVLLKLVAPCPGITPDGRKCAVCAEFSGCGFADPELGYCVDWRVGCDDQFCR